MGRGGGSEEMGTGAVIKEEQNPCITGPDGANCVPQRYTQVLPPVPKKVI